MSPAFWTIAAFLGEAATRVTIVAYILLRRPRPAATNLAWIVVILAVPLAGVCAYFLVGEARLSRGRIARHAVIHRKLRQVTAIERAESRQSAQVQPEYRAIANLATTVRETPPTPGNTLQLIGDTDTFVETLEADIDAAVAHCHLVFYIYLDDVVGQRVARALLRAAERGVACRLLVDDVGSRAFLRSRLARRLADGGVEVVRALPANLLRLLFARIDLRNHRKVVVIDGVRGFVGSHNIADDDFAIKRRFAPWVDAMVRLEGPAARDLQALFAEDWFLDTGESLEPVLSIDPPLSKQGVSTQVLGTGPNSGNEGLHQLTLSAIHTANEEIVITTPYFVPDDATNAALQTAARRGVETRLIVPARNDSPLVAAASRGQYAGLLDAGVSIHEFTGGLLHAKTITFDRRLALITTANLDRRSFELNFESSLLVYDTDFASQLRFLQHSYLDRATTVDAARWHARWWPRRLWENAAGTLSPLL
ncbi:MAG: cardiolipin synthase [Phycisphaerales bacterium]|nr:cardiolipin synthase [Phycisphaerae bacterium]NNF43476.1 cardiolipin synthase [Phycisphaerales bacterium]NNM25317.1 cardiolipin synthase [Phycisphaerales bacterium]